MAILIQTNEKDREIAELQQQCQKALTEKNDLKIKLKTKTVEYDELQKTNATLKNEKKLQDRIATVEKEKNKLQIRLWMVEAEIITLKSEMKEQTEENRKRLQAVENKNEKLEEENQKLSKNLQKVGEEVKELKVEMEDHKEENRELKTAIAANYSEQTVALLHMGELCRQIQNFMYKRILPKHFSSGLNYKVISIEEDIADPSVVTTESERVEAARNLQELKISFNWDVVGKPLKLLQSSRNTEAHPRIDETSLRENAKALNDQGQLKGRLSLELVNELIDIWKTLKQEES